MPTSIFDATARPDMNRHGRDAERTGSPAEAKALGFDAVRFTSADAVEGAGEALDAFLADGRQGDMAWLATTAERRKAPRALWPEASSVIVLGLNYGRGRRSAGGA